MADGHITLWMPEKDPVRLAILGKMAEEASELAGRCARAIIQGLDAIDPDSRRTNEQELRREIADVRACIAWTATGGLLPDDPSYGGAEVSRMQRKLAGYEHWQNLILTELKRQGKI